MRYRRVESPRRTFSGIGAGTWKAGATLLSTFTMAVVILPFGYVRRTSGHWAMIPDTFAAVSGEGGGPESAPKARTIPPPYDATVPQLQILNRRKSAKSLLLSGP